MVESIQEAMFQLTNRITLSQLLLQIQYQKQLLSVMVMLVMLYLKTRISDGLRLSLFHTEKMISHKILLLHPQELNLFMLFSIMLPLEEKKTLHPLSKNNTLSKLKTIFQVSLEMQLILPIERLGGPTPMSLAIWNSKFKLPLIEDQNQQWSKLTKTTLVMEKLMPPLR